MPRFGSLAALVLIAVLVALGLRAACVTAASSDGPERLGRPDVSPSGSPSDLEPASTPEAPRRAELASERGAEARPATEARAQPALDPSLARVRFLVLDLSRPDEPRPIADAVVARPIGRSGEKRWMPLGKTDADGRLEVDLQPGSYGFEVDPRSVDEGLARSGQFSVTGKPMRGVSKVEARLREGDQVDLELALLAGRTISGVVTGPDGAPAEGVTVMASAGAPGMEGLRLIEKTDGAGRFSFEHVYPLRYALHLWSPEPDGSTPPPVFVDVRERSQSGVRMSHGAGSLTVVGAVRDEEGNPIGGLEVLAYYSGPSTDPAAHERYRFDWGDASGLTKTRSDGTFLFERVYRGQDIRLSIGASAAMASGSDRRLLCGLDPVPIHAADVVGDHHDVGTIVARANHPFVLRGRVLDSEGGGQPGAPAVRARLEAEYLGDVDRLGGQWGVHRKPHVEFDRETGVFTVYSDTPKPPIALRAYSSGAKKDATATFHPEPDTTIEGIELVLEL